MDGEPYGQGWQSREAFKYTDWITAWWASKQLKPLLTQIDRRYKTAPQKPQIVTGCLRSGKDPRGAIQVTQLKDQKLLWDKIVSWGWKTPHIICRMAVAEQRPWEEGWRTAGADVWARIYNWAVCSLCGPAIDDEISVIQRQPELFQSV